MTEQTIAVPIDLIKAGDIDAIKELLPKPDYFGRYATHKEHGRVLILSHHADSDDEVVYAVLDPEKACDGEAFLDWGDPAELDFEPVTLTTVEDFQAAPIGTVVTREGEYPLTKIDDWFWRNGHLSLNAHDMKRRGSWRVVQWGAK